MTAGEIINDINKAPSGTKLRTGVVKTAGAAGGFLGGFFAVGAVAGLTIMTGGLALFVEIPVAIAGAAIGEELTEYAVRKGYDLASKG